MSGSAGSLRGTALRGTGSCGSGKPWHSIKKEPEKALEYLTSYSQGKMEQVLQMYKQLHDDLIVKYSNSR
jgi:dipeptidase